jgi:hypothetical protein
MLECIHNKNVLMLIFFLGRNKKKKKKRRRGERKGRLSYKAQINLIGFDC